MTYRERFLSRLGDLTLKMTAIVSIVTHILLLLSGLYLLYVGWGSGWFGFIVVGLMFFGGIAALFAGVITAAICAILTAPVAAILALRRPG